jgi:outer membrane immunogenic protein
MKRFLLASTALALTTPAFAADMPVKAPVAAPRPFSWSSCYLGGNVGAGWGHARLTDTTSAPFVFGAGDGYFAPTGSSVGISSVGGLGGGQIGCDYQFANNWVIGLAGDFSFANIQNEAPDPFFTGKAGPGTFIQIKDRTEWLASATARLGYTWDRVLLYGKGGAAWSRNRYTIENVGFWGTPGTPIPGICATVAGGVLTGLLTCNPTGASTLSGWTVGGGLEFAITDNWSAGIEYDHYGFGTKTVSLVASNFVTLAASPGVSPAVGVPIRQDIDTVKVTVNYRFNTFGR